jgi:aspartyl-tRNA(Asn)/glutamyl-tRNA(Gln) amidotransferase subunit A
MRTLQFINQVKTQEIDIVDHTHKVIDECKKINKEYHYFNVISEDFAIEQAEGIKKELKAKNKKINKKLLGLPVSVKDCICVKGIESRSGSKILNGYKPTFDATVIKKIKDEGAVIIGKTSQDEFGFGSFNTNVGIGFKIPKNPFDKERVTGGSSGGSAGITQKLSFPHISLGESTGGSIVAPSSFCGVFGLCPTYGRVSRYGLIDYANSLDKIGPIGKGVEDVALMLEIISGFDNKESTTLNKPVEDYQSYVDKNRIKNKNNSGNYNLKKLRVGIIKESLGNGVEEAVKDRVLDGILKLEADGVKTEQISLPLTQKYAIACYYLIAMSEASTNLAKYCGMRYGTYDKLQGDFNEYFSKVRSDNLGEEAKRRIIIGTFARMAGFRDAYYIKAMKVRTLIINEYKKIFKKFDALISPTMPIIAPKFQDVEKLTPLQNYMMDIMTAAPNLAGLPHLNVNIGFKDKMPIGMLLIADHLQEGKLLQIASKLA